MFDKYLKWGGLGAMICAKTLMAAGSPDCLDMQGIVRPISTLRVIGQEVAQNGISTELKVDNNDINGYSIQLSSAQPDISKDYSIHVVKITPQHTETAMIQSTSLSTPKEVIEKNPNQAAVGVCYKVYITSKTTHAVEDTLIVNLSDSVGNNNTVEIPFTLSEVAFN